MSTESKRGRVLVVGSEGERQAAASVLTSGGFTVGEADAADAFKLASVLSPEAIVLTVQNERAHAVMAALKGETSTRALPLLVEARDLVTHGGGLREAGADELIPHGSTAELLARVEAAIKSQRLVERALASRARLEALVEIAQAVTSTLQRDEILNLVVQKVGRIVGADRCSVVLIEEPNHKAVVVASQECPAGVSLALDLERYPEVKKALETGETVLVDDASRDPLMQGVQRYIAPLGVRSILVHPLVSQDETLGALFLRVSKNDAAFGSDELDFARAAGSAIANALRNARLHASLRKKRDDLESAYVDRYKELADANLRLKELNNTKDEIIAICSHDLRGPLNVLLGHAKLLHDGNLTKQETSSVDAIIRQGKKVMDLVESLLEKGRGEAARMTIEPVQVDLSHACRELATELEIIGAERGVSVVVQAAPTLTVLADQVKIRQVLQNLVNNALTHAREGGNVRIEAEVCDRPDGRVARVSVIDDGNGIPVDLLPVIFDRYRHGPQGIGLGLSICREFVELHGGEIWATSVAGGGCAFTFTLPLFEGRLPGQKLNPAPVERHRVLLVEDEPEIAAITAEILRTKYRVDVARDGAEGIAKARTLMPDLVVMDVFLPRVDGLDAAAALKAAPDTRDIPVILLSAHQGIAEKVRALNLGAVDYLAKPYQALELLARVESAIKARLTHRRLEKTEGELRRAGIDPLTGLADRAGFLRRFAQEVSRARRYRRPLTLVLLDPQEPAGSGHVASASMVLRTEMRASDVLAHLGSGRFAALLTESTTDSAKGLAGRLAASLTTAMGTEITLGLLDGALGSKTPEELLESAIGDAIALRAAARK